MSLVFGFVSTNHGLPWGASEELWSRAALELLRRGHRVVAAYREWPEDPPRLVELGAAGATIHRLRRPDPRSPEGLRAGLERLGAVTPWGGLRPDFALVSASYHTDDIGWTRALRRRRIPYGIALQCADAGDWLAGRQVAPCRAAWAAARPAWFLSAENREILEAQLALPLPHARIASIPPAFAPGAPLPWPTAPPWRLAVIGRLHPRSKGQDLVLEVLARERWRDRPLEVAFWGQEQEGGEALRTLAAAHRLESRVRFAGFGAPRAIWETYHGLLLPSRYEGIPLATVEAMLAGRVPIVTRCGKNPNLVDDGETGFLAEAATVDLVDEALERAWRARDRWPEIGALGAARVRGRHEVEPIARFADELEAAARAAGAAGGTP